MTFLGERSDCALDKTPVRHRRRAGRLASAALNTRVDHFDETRCDWCFSILNFSHACDPSAGRETFLAGGSVGRAMGKTQTAPNAGGKVVRIEV